nr:hypothetical protein GZ27A8_38 [uncultured archaeon GZfos27A8]
MWSFGTVNLKGNGGSDSGVQSTNEVVVYWLLKREQLRPALLISQRNMLFLQKLPRVSRMVNLL